MEFYKPKDGWLADVMPFFSNGRFYIFYLHDTREWGEQVPGGHWGPVSCRLISTTDFVGFHEHGEVLGRGREGDPDQYYVFTGSVVEALGQYHFFYCGHNPDMEALGRPVQSIMHATSPDLVTWKKHPQDSFGPTQDAYEPNDWRDPFVFWNEEEQIFWMLVTARTKEGPPSRRGCIVLLTSPDLGEWSERGPFWAPYLYVNLECSELFRMGEFWYLVYSTYSERWITHYRVARSLRGPWLAPVNDSFDGRAFYAAKTCFDGTNRYVLGWTPTRRDNDDKGVWEWGGNLLVHQLHQNADGSLSVRAPCAVASTSSRSKRFAVWAQGTRCSAVDGKIELFVRDGFSYALGQEIPARCRVEGTVIFTDGTNGCGLILKASVDLESAYYIRLEPRRGRVVMDLWPRRGDLPFAPELERPVSLRAGREHRFLVFLSDTMCVAYIDDAVAMTFRTYNTRGRRLGVFCSEGKASFAEVRVWS